MLIRMTISITIKRLATYSFFEMSMLFNLCSIASICSNSSIYVKTFFEVHTVSDSPMSLDINIIPIIKGIRTIQVINPPVTICKIQFRHCYTWPSKLLDNVAKRKPFIYDTITRKKLDRKAMPSKLTRSDKSSSSSD